MPKPPKRRIPPENEPETVVRITNWMREKKGHVPADLRVLRRAGITPKTEHGRLVPIQLTKPEERGRFLIALEEIPDHVLSAVTLIEIDAGMNDFLNAQDYQMVWQGWLTRRKTDKLMNEKQMDYRRLLDGKAETAALIAAVKLGKTGQPAELIEIIEKIAFLNRKKPDFLQPLIETLNEHGLSWQELRKKHKK